jgi:hypothetical protein
MDDVCWGTQVLLSECRLCVRSWYGTHIVQIRFQIPYYDSAFGFPNMIFS